MAGVSTNQDNSKKNENPFDELLRVLSHSGRVSWSQFRFQAEELLGVDSELFARSSLSRLGHIDYLPDTSTVECSWPSIALLPGSKEHVAVLCGRRSSELEQQLEETAARYSVGVSRQQQKRSPTAVFLKGSIEQISTVASSMNISNAGAASLNIVSAMRRTVLSSPDVLIESVSGEIADWTSCMTGLETQERPDEIAVAKVQELSGRRRWLLAVGNSGYFMMRASALHLGARMLGQSSISYDSISRSISVPEAFFSLPVLLDRAATLCSGREPEKKAGQWIYANVPPAVFAAIDKLLIPTLEGKQ